MRGLYRSEVIFCQDEATQIAFCRVRTMLDAGCLLPLQATYDFLEIRLARCGKPQMTNTLILENETEIVLCVYPDLRPAT